MSENITKQSMRIAKLGYSGNDNGSNISFNSGLVLQSVFSGAKNPQYRAQIKAVTSATTVATGVKRHCDVTIGFGARNWLTSLEKPPANNPNAYKRSFLLTYYVPRGLAVGADPDRHPSLMASARNQAIARLYDRLSSFESSAQTGEDLGEISHTIKQLRSPAKPAQDLLRGLLDKHQRILGPLQRSSGLKAIPSVAKGLADLTLEYRFGIKPLINTVASAVVGLQNRDYLAHYYPFTVNGSTETGTQTSDVEFCGSRGIFTTKVVKEIKQVRFSGVWGVQASVNRRSVDDVLSLRWKDVIPTVWNLIPYSFLVDYFTNVGDIVNGLSVPWSGVRWCVETQRAVRNTFVEGNQWYPASPEFAPGGSLSPGSIELHEVSFSRAPVVSIPRPTLEFSLPHGKQWLNVAALIVSRVATIGKVLSAVDPKRGKALQSAFADEVGQRGLRVPYPFHH